MVHTRLATLAELIEWGKEKRFGGKKKKTRDGKEPKFGFNCICDIIYIK